MLMLVYREPRPNAPDWPGRRALAAVDAVAWPLLMVWLVNHAPVPTGLVGSFVVAVTALIALNRLHRALWANHRYWFTAWRWGKVLAMLLLIGAMLKLAV
jgi:hypothetical protein